MEDNRKGRRSKPNTEQLLVSEGNKTKREAGRKRWRPDAAGLSRVLFVRPAWTLSRTTTMCASHSARTQAEFVCADHLARPSPDIFSSPLSSGRRLSIWCRRPGGRPIKFEKKIYFVELNATRIPGTRSRCFMPPTHQPSAFRLHHTIPTAHLLGIFCHTHVTICRRQAESLPPAPSHTGCKYNGD